MDNSIFNCAICCFKYNESNRKPLSLPCGHVFCQDCVSKLTTQTIEMHNQETVPSLVTEESAKVVICPSDKSKHVVNLHNLPLCYAILQHLPGVKQSLEFQGALGKRIGGQQEVSDEENLRVEFKNVYKVAQEELKKSKYWDDVVKQVNKRLTENCHEQINNINMAFDKAIVSLNEKRQRLISEIKHMYEKEQVNVDREKYVRKKHLEEIHEIYNELKKADKRIFNLDYEKLFCITRRNQQRLNVVCESKNDFTTKIISFTDTLKFSCTGAISSKNKIITHESVCKDSRGKSVDTRMSKDTFEDLEEFSNHPKFEYEAMGQSRGPKTRRNKDKLRESIHKSTSPRLHRNSTVKNMNLNYVSSNKSKVQKDMQIKKEMTSDMLLKKNHRSMLKLQEKKSNPIKKVSSFMRDKSASNLNVKPAFNLDRTDNLIEQKYNNSSLCKIPEFPKTDRSDFGMFEPKMVKQSKSRTRYENTVLSSSEKEEENKYKRKNAEYSHDVVKRSKDEAEVIKSIAKDDFNPFLFNPIPGEGKHQENSERIANKKMFSRVPSHLQNEKNNTVNMKEQLQILKNDRLNRKKDSSNSGSSKYNKNSTPNVEQRSGNELDVICEEYGSKIEEPFLQREKMMRLKDVQKDYKSSQNDPRCQFNRYTSNKQSKAMLKKHREHKHKENENTVNDTHQKKGEYRSKGKKMRSKHHKKKAKHNTSF